MKNMIVWVEKKKQKNGPLDPLLAYGQRRGMRGQEFRCFRSYRWSGVGPIPSQHPGRIRTQETALVNGEPYSRSGSGEVKQEMELSRGAKTRSDGVGKLFVRGGMRHLLPSQVEEGLKMQREILQEGNTSERGIESPGKKGDSRRSPLPYSSGAE